MNILVIKQTSLGDVLHSTGHVRALKERWPNSRLTLLTATSSLDIYRHSPHIDRIITVDRYRIKREWLREPRWAFGHMRSVMAEVREQTFDLAFDLQGLAKSVVFLYGARARKKYVKGGWPGITGFRNPALHAIREMDGVLGLAGVEGIDTSMEFATSDAAKTRVAEVIDAMELPHRPLLVLSPFSRWRSKDWPLSRFVEIADQLGETWRVAFTGAPDKADEISAAIAAVKRRGIYNLAGNLTLDEFAELVRHANLMLTGDSFPMHVASAVNTPVLALFGPTDESRVGPLGARSTVLRVDDCDRCDRANCPRRCLDRLQTETVLDALTGLNVAIERAV